jgi:single-strand DNA-binding protein
VNKLTITGNLTADPQSHTTSEGKEVCNFTVAVNRRKKVPNQPEADFFRVAVWGAKAGPCQKYLAKGKKVAVVGPVSVSTYEANDGTTRANMEVFAEEVEFLSSAGGNTSGQDATTPPDDQQAGFTAVESDELPF